MELVLIGVGLSMDAFAVALCKGLSMRRVNYAHAAVIALFFGVFQAVMPLIGWVLGTQFARHITSVDHGRQPVVGIFSGTRAAMAGGRLPAGLRPVAADGSVGRAD